VHTKEIGTDENQLKEKGAIYMSKIIRKRVSALLVSALMVASSVTVTSGSFFVEAAGSTVTIGKTLETSVPNPEDKDNPLNADKCTYMCKAATDEYTSFTDTKGKSPADICGDSRDAAQYGICRAGQHRECAGSRRSGR